MRSILHELNISSTRVASVMSGFTYSYAFCSEWLTQIFVGCNIIDKGKINEVRLNGPLKEYKNKRELT